jgi:hypothetical protein
MNNNTLVSFLEHPECLQSVSTYVLGVLLFVSEALPFFKSSKTHDEEEAQEKVKGSVLQESDGVIQLMTKLFHNMTMKK